MAMPFIRGDVLEVGCGYTPIPPMITLQDHYVGIDYNPEVITKLALTYPSFEFLQLDVEHQVVDLGTRRFDTLVLLAVFEHWFNPTKVLSSLVIYLRDDGRVVLTTPTPFGNEIHRLGARWGIFSREAVAEHHSIVNENKLRQSFEAVGLRLCVYRPFQFGANQFAVGEKRMLPSLVPNLGQS
ncbi:MAG: class I SAM-dependent methyltransferase [Chloroflexi bacterium]|nr:class I SAM-dependent methyltransferase [Chloroflexota bacterium]